MALDSDKHRLTEAKHEKVFERIKADIFADAKTSERPVAVIFGGQPGSGKSAALSKTMAELLRAILIHPAVPQPGQAKCLTIDARDPRFR